MIRPFEGGDWALVPTPELLSAIKNRMLAEKSTTKMSGSNSCVSFTSLKVGQVVSSTWHDLKWIGLQRSPDQAKQEHEYIFLPLGIISKRLPVIRREWARELPGNPPQFTIHYPPYSDVPHVWSSAHPYFVIMNAHWKLLKYPPPEDHPLLLVWQDVRDIHDMWMGAEDMHI